MIRQSVSAQNHVAETVNDLTQKNVAPLVGLVKRFDGRANSSEWADAMHTDTAKLGHHRRVLQGLGLVEFTGEREDAEGVPSNVKPKVFEVTDRGREVVDARADEIVLPMPPGVMADEIRSLRGQMREQEDRIDELEARLDEIVEKHNDLLDVVQENL